MKLYWLYQNEVILYLPGWSYTGIRLDKESTLLMKERELQLSFKIREMYNISETIIFKINYIILVNSDMVWPHQHLEIHEG